MKELTSIGAGNENDILARFELAHTAGSEFWSPLQDKYRQEKRFIFKGEQWTVSQKNERKGRPTTTVNKSLGFVKSVTNQGRVYKPSIKVVPGEDGDKKKAQFRADLIRAIERTSCAAQAYQTAYDDAVGCGYGAISVNSKFESEESFNQEITINRVCDASNIMCDPNYQELSASDAKWWIIEESTNAAAAEKYGEDVVKYLKKENRTKNRGIWGNINEPKLFAFWEIIEIDEMLYRMNPDEQHPKGWTAWESELEDADRENIEKDDQGDEVKRKSARRQVFWHVLIGGKVVSAANEWDGYYIPWVLVPGREITVDGKKTYDGLMSQSHDSAVAYNYIASNKLEKIALAPKPRYLAPKGGIPPEEKTKWNTSNTKAHPYLEYNAYDAKGQPLPAPHFEQGSVLDPALIQAQQDAAQELKEVTGIYDPSLGNRSNETSGIAIRTRQQQSDVATADFPDNRDIALRQVGRIILDLIPKKYDKARQVRILGEDEQEKIVWINKPAVDENRRPYHYDVTEGKYDCIVEVGPSTSTKMQESSEWLQKFIQSVPQVGQLGADEFLKLQNIPVLDKVAKRIKRSLPPNITEGEEEPGEPQRPPQPPPQMVQAMQQMQIENQQLKEVLGKINVEAQKQQTEKARLILEKQKIDVDVFNAKTNRMKAMGELQLKGQQFQFDAVATMAEWDRELANDEFQQQQAMKGPTGATDPGNNME